MIELIMVIFFMRGETPGEARPMGCSQVRTSLEIVKKKAGEE